MSGNRCSKSTAFNVSLVEEEPMRRRRPRRPRSRRRSKSRKTAREIERRKKKIR